MGNKKRKMKNLLSRLFNVYLVRPLVIFIFILAFNYTNAQIKADPQDSLVLLQFHQELLNEGWPEVWNTDLNVINWGGVWLDAATGKVQSISIRGDRFSPPFETDDLPSAIGILKSLNSLTDLGLGLLGIKSLPKEIGDLQNIESLALGYNQLSNLPPEINQLTNLKYLLINDNRFTDLPDLSGLTNLENISLTSNRTLTKVPQSIFSLQSLTELRIGYTSITEIPEDIALLTNLRVIDADAALLSSLPNGLTTLPSLIDLEVSYNKLTELPANIGNLRELRDLDISGNQLTALPASMSQLTKLVQIRFTRNNFSEFPPVLAGLPNLRYIFGERNQMQGRIPAAVFNISGLRLYLEDNELSGELLIQPGKVPDRLYIKNNRFTLKSIIDHYPYFQGITNNKYLQFHPQKKIGTFRTLYLNAGDDLELSVDNYDPVDGAEFIWYKKPSITSLDAFQVSTDEALILSDFDTASDGGVYYCTVSHSALPSITLESEPIRVIGEDKPPIIQLSDLTFRSSDTPDIIAGTSDDFTPLEELDFDWPDATDHINLQAMPGNPWNNGRRLQVIDPTWTGTDMLTVTVRDENGNTAIDSASITVLPNENELPHIDIPDIYLNIIDDIEIPCTPGTSGCSAFYPFVSMTYLKHFVSDDLTPSDELSYRILEADPISGMVSDKVFLSFNDRPDGMTLDATIIANQDTTVTVTLEVTDEEGGVQQAQITFIDNATSPNMPPQISNIPEQVISKGTTHFPALDLNLYVSDDYLENELLEWIAAPFPDMQVEMSNSIALVRPTYVDSSYSNTVTYIVHERTNYLRINSREVNYAIAEDLQISGKISDTEGRPIEGVDIAGFDDIVTTEADGSYLAEVPYDWSGTVTPYLNEYVFDPIEIAIENVKTDFDTMDFTGSYTGMYTISGSILDEASEPLAGVILTGAPENVITDVNGFYQIKVEPGWSGEIKPDISNYSFDPMTYSYDRVNSDVSEMNFKAFVITAISVGADTRLMTVHPNPTDGPVNITLNEKVTNALLRITNIHGKVVKEIEIDSNQALIYQADIQLLPGLYYIRLISNQQVLGKVKIVVIE